MVQLIRHYNRYSCSRPSPFVQRVCWAYLICRDSQSCSSYSDRRSGISGLGVERCFSSTEIDRPSHSVVSDAIIFDSYRALAVIRAAVPLFTLVNLRYVHQNKLPWASYFSQRRLRQPLWENRQRVKHQLIFSIELLSTLCN